MSVLQMPNSV